MPRANPPDPVLDNSSPYFVHPGDGPSLSLLHFSPDLTTTRGRVP
ncbi:hypothetical protein A2U01_0116983 [Trifolium medium]|uniref:Uncharacterized protein n=1 Tax=Trifolium medium TaxID=97028 RepID=A0A392WA04_9FABA|nr:hypothetical protein [Trifolium medium]